jgi:glycosyltransferase involved in cell wall biosynthesis
MLLFPTRADTSPNAVKEAVVAGVPVVASRIGGIPDYVVPGKNGILFEPDSVEACVQGLREAMEHPLFRSGLVDQQTLRAMREYLSPKAMAEKFLAAYHELLHGPRVRSNQPVTW